MRLSFSSALVIGALSTALAFTTNAQVATSNTLQAPQAISNAAVPNIAVAQANLSRLYPQVPFATPKVSDIPGLLEVTILGSSETVYVSYDGTHLISGTVLRISGNQAVDIAEEKNMPVRAAKLAALDLSKTLVYPASGIQKARIYVFTDISCGYCRRLHGQIGDLNDAGVEVVYLAYPRDAQSRQPTAYRAMTGFWCDADAKEELDEAFDGARFPAKNCPAVMEQYRLGSSMGVNSTPHLFFEDGTRIAGALPTDQILARLGIQ